MARNAELLDWQVVLDDNAWARPETLAELVEASSGEAGSIAPKAQSKRLRMRRVWYFALLVLFNVACGGYLLWEQANRGYQEIEAEIGEIVELETWSAQTGNRAVANSLVDRDAPAEWRQQIAYEAPLFRGDVADQEVTISAVELLDDLAMVQVRVSQPDGGLEAAYRATRYYRRSNEQWVRTPPNPRFWGAAQTLETTYFQFRFQIKDRAAVEEAAQRMDEIYLTVRRDLGLAHPPSDALKRTIEVVATLPSRNLFYPGYVDQLLVVSPLVLTIPDSVSDGEILGKAMIHLLVRDVMNEAQSERNVRLEWAHLAGGIGLWQAYLGSESLPAWYTQTVTWLEQDAQAIRQRQQTPDLRDLNLVCRGYDLWGVSVPMDLSVPSLCLVHDWSLRLQYMRLAPTSLGELVYVVEQPDYLNHDPWFNEWMENVTAATLVEYLVETYGRDRLPVLIDAMRFYDTWEELIPEVVDVSAAEFERGWQDYVATRYAGCVEECGEELPMAQP